MITINDSTPATIREIALDHALRVAINLGWNDKAKILDLASSFLIFLESEGTEDETAIVTPFRVSSD